MENMMTTDTLPELPTPKYTETIRGVPCITLTEHEHLMRAYALQAITKATQAEVTDEREAFEAEMRCEDVWGHRSLKKRTDGRYENWQVDLMWDVWQARSKLALRPVQVPMTDEVFDLICNAIDKADTITMEGDYMLDSDDCIAVVRVMQALLSAHHGITAQAKKEQA